MDTLSARSLLIVAMLQASVAAAALASSRTAALAAGAIGALAIGRYAAVAFFASTIGSSAKAGIRAFAASAWVLGLAALLVAVAAVALRARAALPWAVAAAIAGPLGMSALALVSGLRALSTGHPASDRPAHSGGAR
jgi:hypothetical protein